MCGIFGNIGRKFRNIDDVFSTHLKHRGPDDSGVYYDESQALVLGHRRLSIIDLSNYAHQPMVDQNNNYALVFNGEVYNYLDLRKELEKLGRKFISNSDTEVVLQSYIAWGASCVEHFRGMFAFCIYDKNKNELFLARDRFGIKPLFYNFSELEGFVFSSELKPILKSDLWPKKLCKEALTDYLYYGSVQQPRTILEGFYSLMPGHAMTVRMDYSHNIYKYYDFVKESLSIPSPNKYCDAVTQVRNELECATQFHMIGDVEVGAFLSGGVDSTAVVALMQQRSSQPIHTFCLGFSKKENVEDETDIATRSAKYIGTKHHNIKIDAAYVSDIFDDFIDSLDQPSVDGINTYIVSRETSKELKVALSGLGGDEVFAGYPHFRDISNFAGMERGILTYFSKYIHSIKPNKFTRSLLMRGLAEESSLKLQRKIQSPENILKYSRNDNNIEINTALSSIQRISKSEIDGYMLNTLLRDNDALSMANSLEVRPVLLDHKLAELAFRLNDNFKVRGGQLKSVFIDSVVDLIPPEVAQRRKTGFEMPFASWMNGELNRKVVKVMTLPEAELLFTSNFLKSFRARADRQALKRSDWMILVLLSWLKCYEVEL